MKCTLCILLSIFLFHTTLSSQSPNLEQTILIEEKVAYDVTQLKVVGAKESSESLEWFYTFTHPKGGVQTVNGPLISGGKEPTDLKAISSVTISPNTPPMAGPVQWEAGPLLV